MTSEVEDLKTNEFLRRRKLRIQQVREQSKDIAKKVRQRAKVEKIRQVTEIDAKKQRDYQEQRDELIFRLEQFRARSLQNVGSSHKNAELKSQVKAPVTVDLSRQRGKEAAAELRRKKQEKLDQQKKLLDRKLLAREAANGKSREKLTTVAQKLLTKPLQCKSGQEQRADKSDNPTVAEVQDAKDKPNSVTADMATQWDFEALPQEWEPHIPVLSLIKENGESGDSPKDCNQNEEDKDNRSEKSKKPNLFAVSDEMPSSLCGGLDRKEYNDSYKPSLTLVSEYLQNRKLRLRGPDNVISNKRSVIDLPRIKETILRTRAGTEGSVCHVADVQMVPVPSWHAEDNSGICSHNVTNYKSSAGSKLFNDIYSKTRYFQHDLNPNPVLRGTSPFKRWKVHPNSFSAKSSSDKQSEKAIKLNHPDNGLKKSSVTVYNHSTRDTKEVPFGDKRLVCHDTQPQEDAFSLAMKESSLDVDKSKDNQKKMRDARNKIAMTKQSVEKEFKDTMAFLNSLPKDKSKPIKNAYKDEKRQRMQKESQQRTLQQEYKKIEKECKKHSRGKSKSVSPTKEKTKSSPEADKEDDFNAKDFQYSWMPVPESDGSLAIHTIPTTLKENKSGNTVKFSQVDSYHEYRSRHKHTPPTKDTPGLVKSKRVVEAVVVEQDESEQFMISSSDDTSDRTSGDDFRLERNKPKRKKENSEKLTDAEKIIIYKVLDSKHKRKNKVNKSRRHRLSKEIAKLLDPLEYSDEDDRYIELQRRNKNDTAMPFDQLTEGVYKTVSNAGDNVTSLYFPDTEKDVPAGTDVARNTCGKPTIYKTSGQQNNPEGDKQYANDHSKTRSRTVNVEDKSVMKTKEHKQVETHPSACTSTTSFKTATNDKATELPEKGFIKLLDEEGQDAGKFYIGATGFLKNDDYEVIIQLRKKDNISKQDKEIISTDDQVTKNKIDSDSEKNLCTVNPIDLKQPDKNYAPQILQNSPPPPPPPSKTSSSNKASDFPEQLTSVFITQQDLHTAASSNDPASKSDDPISEYSSPKSSDNAITEKSVPKSPDNPISEQFPPKSSNCIDASVYATFQDSFTNLTKPEAPKPAASICTQTSFDSPSQRPVFIHMSSTSTAYMSPPEMILPSFLKPDYERNQTEAIGIEDQKRTFEEYDTCRCRKCRHAKKVTLTPLKEVDGKRSMSPCTVTSDNGQQTCGMRRKKKKSSTQCKKIKKCQKCQSYDYAPEVIAECYLCKDHRVNKGMRPKCVLSPACKNKPKPNLRSKEKRTSSNHDLNPVIKWYVEKLLNLNRDSLKAINVANQDCSAVTTPGSSIVDVPRNFDPKNRTVNNKISLEQLKDVITQQVLKSYKQEQEANVKNADISEEKKVAPRISRKKMVHKIKTLNISKKLSKSKSNIDQKSVLDLEKPISCILTTNACFNINYKPCTRSRSQSSPSPRNITEDLVTTGRRNRSSELITQKHDTTSKNPVDQIQSNEVESLLAKYREEIHTKCNDKQPQGSTSDSEFPRQPQTHRVPLNMSTQTKQSLDDEINFIKMAEDKLQNMEKIADLTEICTKRLSNLAKVLEEVRRNKSLAYTGVSDSGTDTDRNSENTSDDQRQTYEPKIEIKEAPKHTLPTSEQRQKDLAESMDYIPFLQDIPKPDLSKPSQVTFESQIPTDLTKVRSQNSSNSEHTHKGRGRPPPALSRKNLKNGQDVVPHELSTVLEIDSPLSIKLKNQSTRNDTTCTSADFLNPNKKVSTCEDTAPTTTTTANNANDLKISTIAEDEHLVQKNEECIEGQNNDPDLVKIDINMPQRELKQNPVDSVDSKIQMMDMKQFNEIMLKPFISIQEYAKQCNIGVLEEVSNLEDTPKDDVPKENVVNDDLSSLHSDGSLPDVIAELLKRNIISEPFKFDTNSTTVSSESTLSMLALSKARKDKKKSSVALRNKENVAETSDTLSISSNPDLETVFKKLGIGWASSTLKKTKERLALSSSSNTSSSSLPQFRVKNNNPDDLAPVTVTNSAALVHDISRKPLQNKIIGDNINIKNVEQQTSVTTNSMTVKQFLTNELAKKITFTNKNNTDDTEEEFISLYETKMPEDMKHMAKIIRAEQSMDSGPSGGNNRARTSTPMQIYKSMTYHSSSSSNVSNGLFSNADLSSVKGTSNSQRNHSTSDKDDLTIPNYSLRMKKGSSDVSE